MSRFNELSQTIGIKAQKALRNSPNTRSPLLTVLSDSEFRQAVLDLIYHYKDMTHEKPISTGNTVSERGESELPGATERNRPKEVQTITN